jgi:ABC-2 type transport system permease protein
MSELLRPGLVSVAVREVRWIWHDRVALFLVVGVPLIAFAVLSLTFSNAVVRNLRVDVVDRDMTQTSLLYVQALNAAPSVSVTQRSTDLTAAMHAVRSGEAIAAVYLPRYLERDIAAGKRPQIVIFYNRQYFTPGNIASAALAAAVSAATADLPTVPGPQSYSPGALVVEQYVLTNPALNYGQFLLRAILPTVLHVVIAIAAGYAVGSEFGSRSLGEWMAAAGGQALTALVGKLAPYFGIFALMMVVDAVTIHGAYQVPFAGSAVVLGASACLLIVAYLSLGALLQLLARNLPFGLTLTAILCSPAFGFAGVGFPLLGMSGFALVWGAILPLRWHLQVLFDQAARGVPPVDSLEPVAAVAVLALVYFSLAVLRLRSVARGWRPAPEEVAPAAEGSARIGMVGAFVEEYRRVLRDRAAFGLFVLGPILYGVLYPQPYLGQLVRAVPIAVVDNDSTELSRAIIQDLNASEALHVAVRADTLADAQAALSRREVFAILDIPAGTERDVFAGRRARLPAYVDAAYFLVRSRALEGILDATGQATADLLSRDARPDGSLYRAALIKSSPVEVLNQPLFNPTGGYASYIVPAAFMLIVQQTVLMGSATVAGLAFQQGGASARRRRGALAAVPGQGLAHLLLALPGAVLYLVVLPRIYGFSATAAHLGDLLALVIPFILSVSFLGQFAGTWFKRRETAVLLFIASSLPLFFLVGVSWPVEALPSYVQAARFIFPSTSAIDGLVRINQMDASLSDVFRDWAVLWGLVLLYGSLAVLSAWRLSATRGVTNEHTA